MNAPSIIIAINNNDTLMDPFESLFLENYIYVFTLDARQ